MRILFYGHLGDAIGREIDFPADGIASVGDLRKALCDAHPEHAAELTSARSKVLIGDDFVDDEAPLANAAQAEFLPPVSGG